MTKIHGHTRERGYIWKLCPYSEDYETKYYDDLALGTSPGFSAPVYDEDGLILGWQQLPEVTVSEHSYTNGTMNMKTRGAGAGWICLDDNCWYFTTYGIRYHEI